MQTIAMPSRPAPGLILASLVLMWSGPGCSRAPEVGTANASEAPTAAPVASVVTVAPRRESIRKVTREPGQIEAFEVTALAARVAGYVQSLAVDTGDPVRAGQVIATLSVPELESAVQQQRALLAQTGAERRQAEAALGVAQAALATAVAKVTQAQASVRRSEADVARWQAEYARTGQLVRESAITASVLDEARSKLEAAQAAREESAALVGTAQAAQAQAKAEVTQADADLITASARVDVAQANLAAAEALAADTRIVAPFDGVISRRFAHTGHLTTAGKTAEPLFIAERIDRLRIVVGVPEVDAPFVQAGDRAEVRLQALEGRTVSGTVARTSWSLDRATRTLRAEVDLDNPDGSLRPGHYAYVTIIAEERPDVLTLPAAAIVREGATVHCVVVEEARAVHRALELGLSDGKSVEILKGLQGGEAVVAANAAAITDGQPLQGATPAAK